MLSPTLSSPFPILFLQFLQLARAVGAQPTSMNSSMLPKKQSCIGGAILFMQTYRFAHFTHYPLYIEQHQTAVSHSSPISTPTIVAISLKYANKVAYYIYGRQAIISATVYAQSSPKPASAIFCSILWQAYMIFSTPKMSQRFTRKLYSSPCGKYSRFQAGGTGSSSSSTLGQAEGTGSSSSSTLGQAEGTGSSSSSTLGQAGGTGSSSSSTLGQAGGTGSSSSSTLGQVENSSSQGMDCPAAGRASGCSWSAAWMSSISLSMWRQLAVGVGLSESERSTYYSSQSQLQNESSLQQLEGFEFSYYSLSHFYYYIYYCILGGKAGGPFAALSFFPYALSFFPYALSFFPYALSFFPYALSFFPYALSFFPYAFFSGLASFFFISYEQIYSLVWEAGFDTFFLICGLILLCTFFFSFYGCFSFSNHSFSFYAGTPFFSMRLAETAAVLTSYFFIYCCVNEALFFTKALPAAGGKGFSFSLTIYDLGLGNTACELLGTLGRSIRQGFSCASMREGLICIKSARSAGASGFLLLEGGLLKKLLAPFRTAS